jgi:hypothetical protein
LTKQKRVCSEKLVAGDNEEDKVKSQTKHSQTGKLYPNIPPETIPFCCEFISKKTDLGRCVS